MYTYTHLHNNFSYGYNTISSSTGCTAIDIHAKTTVKGLQPATLIRIKKVLVMRRL